MGGPLDDGRLEIAGHAHGEVVDAGFFGKRGKHPEMNGRVLFGGRNAHQAIDRQAGILPEAIDERHCIFWQYPCLLGFSPCIDLDEKPGRPALSVHFGCDRGRNLFPVHGLDDIEKRDCQRCFVALQRTNKVQFDIRKLAAQFRPFCGSFLDPVLAEDALPGIKCRSDVFGIEILADRYKLYGAQFAVAFPFGPGNAGSDGGEFACNIVQIGNGAVPASPVDPCGDF